MRPDCLECFHFYFKSEICMWCRDWSRVVPTWCLVPKNEIEL